MIELQHNLVTDFHRGLFTDSLLEQLSHAIDAHFEFKGKKGSGQLSSQYNEDRFMGPNSVVKYRFGVDIQLDLGLETPFELGYTLAVKYCPDDSEFLLSDVRWKFRWWKDAEVSALRELDRAAAETIMVNAGALRHLAFDPERLDPTLGEVLNGKRVGYEYGAVVVDQSEDYFTVAFSDPRLLESLEEIQSVLGRGTRPVLASEELVTRAVEELFGPQIAVETVDIKVVGLPSKLDYVPLVDVQVRGDEVALPAKLQDTERLSYVWCLTSLGEMSLPEVAGGGEAFRFVWSRSFKPPVIVRVQRQGSRCELILKVQTGDGGVGLSTRSLCAESWKTLQQRLLEADFWALPVQDGRCGLDGASWFLEGYDGKRHHGLLRWSPNGGPFLECCLYLLENSGLILKVKREVHYE